MRHILFVCTQNAGRSQMAAAFFDRLAPADVRADTAGTRPGERIHPAVVEAMRERGLDLSRRRPRLLTVEEQLRASLAVTLSCDGRCSFVARAVEEWPIDDPAGAPIDEVRRIRDEIEQRVTTLVRERIDDARRPPDEHERRLMRLLLALARRFGGRRSPHEIRAAAEHALRIVEAGARNAVRPGPFPMSLAHRLAREQLA
ncbi:arsenate-mycothiol transferase ArsC [Patulibacter defluvii]|uniref:arsenate-mycothiol transferase ArsC n=1 Tax=Patulibacter defluvii TaxID=3095358 RepID=UPI002A7617F8|nr:hypothetical protein [Patulibacter sp. DM4]